MTVTFMPPTVDRHFNVGKDLAERAVSRMCSPLKVGQTLWRTDGTWHLGTNPSTVALNAADLVFHGGAWHEVDDDLFAEIVAFLGAEPPTLESP